MIIVNQKRDEFINFDNVINVSITYCEEDGYLISAGFIVGRDDNYRDLGYFKTEERAKEILQEIIEIFTAEEMFHINKSSLNNLDELAEPKYILRPISKLKAYYMPKD